MTDPTRNGDGQKLVIPVKEVTDPCPDCGAQLVHQEGIIECLSCGYQNTPG